MSSLLERKKYVKRSDMGDRTSSCCSQLSEHIFSRITTLVPVSGLRLIAICFKFLFKEWQEHRGSRSSVLFQSDTPNYPRWRTTSFTARRSLQSHLFDSDTDRVSKKYITGREMIAPTAYKVQANLFLVFPTKIHRDWGCEFRSKQNASFVSDCFLVRIDSCLLRRTLSPR